MSMGVLNARMRAVIVDRSEPGELAIDTVDTPHARRNEAVIRVAATSVNRCDLLHLTDKSVVDGARPGRDLSGTVERAAPDGTGLAAGTRVVGLVASGSWAEFVCVASDAIVALPDAVSFSRAATLPTAGLTALDVLGRGGSLAGRPVLVTGASGGVGLFALQIAQVSGAHTVALLRNDEHDALVEDHGADQVVVGDGSAASRFGPYHLIADATDDPALAAAALLRPGGVRVVFGAAGILRGPQPPQDAGAPRHMDHSAPLNLEGWAVADGLERLVFLLRSRRIRTHIEVETSWTNVATVAQQLEDRAFAGKAVLLM